jgi:hypothetical protein
MRNSRMQEKQTGRDSKTFMLSCFPHSILPCPSATIPHPIHFGWIRLDLLGFTLKSPPQNPTESTLVWFYRRNSLCALVPSCETSFTSAFIHWDSLGSTQRKGI